MISFTKGDDFLVGQSTPIKTKIALLGQGQRVRPCRELEPKQQKIGTMEKQNKPMEEDKKGRTFDFSVARC